MSELAGLVEKYRTLVALRRSREEAIGRGEQRFGADEGRERRRLMRALARRFPGALRELDAFDVAELSARLAAVERAEAGAGDPELAFARAMADYHRVLRHALFIKLFLARARGQDAHARARGLEEAYARHPPEGERPWTELDAQLLARFEQPERGRLQPLVFALVAARQCVSAEALQRLLFGPAPRPP